MKRITFWTIVICILIWLALLYIALFVMHNLIILLISIALFAILYYLYNNSVKQECVNRNQQKNEGSQNNDVVQVNSNKKFFKKIVLGGFFGIFIWAFIVYLISAGLKKEMVVVLYLLPLTPIIFIFYPAYFIILSVRYFKERKKMDVLDKIMFYLLLFSFILSLIFVFEKIKEKRISGQRQIDILQQWEVK